MLLRQLNFGVMSVFLTAILRLLQRENSTLVCCFYCYVVKEGRALKVASQFVIRWLVAYKPVAYKKISTSFVYALSVVFCIIFLTFLDHMRCFVRFDTICIILKT